MIRVLLFLCCSVSILSAQIDFTLRADGFSRPLDIVSDGLQEGIYIVEQTGKIIYVEGRSQQEIIDLSAEITTRNNEQGLLGLAFHPDYGMDSRAFVYYTARDGDIVIASLEKGSGLTLDISTLKTILRYPQPFANHNGGCLRFGPDGYLYVGTGDGGSRDDPGNRSQNVMDPLGKMLRIDINNGDPYSIPETNPFADDDFALDEIWATGLRNPWRFSFDKSSGDLWIADVGQDAREEVNRQLADSPGGENYGWRCKEGIDDYITDGCVLDQLVDPYYDYAHPGNGCSVTGGEVSYSPNAAELSGKYVYGDICSSNIWAINFSGDEPVNEFLGRTPGGGPSGFGSDRDGRLYVAILISGEIYEITGTLVSNDEVEHKSIDIFYDPSSEILQVDCLNDSRCQGVRLYDMSGHLMPISFNSNISLAHLSEGVYIAHVQLDEQVVTYKFFKY